MGILSSELVVVHEMRPDRVHQLSGMVVDGPADATNPVELFVGVSELPSGRVVDFEV